MHNISHRQEFGHNRSFTEFIEFMLHSSRETTKFMKSGRVVLSEGTFELEAGIYIQLTNTNTITLEGAGSSKTIIKAKDPKTFIDNIGSALTYRRLLEVYKNGEGLNVTLQGLTIDGTGIEGTIGSILKSPIDFVPLRLTGTGSNANITLNDIQIKRNTGSKNKGCIQIGANNPHAEATVTATNLYVNSNVGDSNYADIDICDGSSLTVNAGGGFNGIILGNCTMPSNDAPGYYTAQMEIGDPDTWGITKQDVTFCTTIPFFIDCYYNREDELGNYSDLVGYLQEDDLSIIDQMVNDLIIDDSDTLLYDYTNCNDQRTLAEEFSVTLNGIATALGISDVAESQQKLSDSLAASDWHTWSDDQDTECDVCHATRVIEPEYDVKTEHIDATAGTGEHASTTATGFVTTITNAADITSIQWQITSGSETRETKVFTNIPTAEVTGELKLGIIITGLNDDAATATAIINPKAEEVTE